MNTLPADAQPVCHTDPNPSYWFPEDFPYGGKAPTKYAKAGCGRCEFQTKCLTLAVELDERHGVWGGLTADERAALVDGAVA